MYMCRVISCVVEKGWLLWPVCFLVKTLLAFALLNFVLQDQTCLLLQVSLDFLLLHSSPLWWKWHLFSMLILEGLVGLHRTIQLLWPSWLGDRHSYWIICLGNEQSSFIFEIAPKYWMLTYTKFFDVAPFIPEHTAFPEGSIWCSVLCLSNCSLQLPVPEVLTNVSSFLLDVVYLRVEQVPQISHG